MSAEIINNVLAKEAFLLLLDPLFDINLTIIALFAFDLELSNLAVIPIISQITSYNGNFRIDFIIFWLKFVLIDDYICLSIYDLDLLSIFHIIAPIVVVNSQV